MTTKPLGEGQNLSGPTTKKKLFMCVFPNSLSVPLDFFAAYFSATYLSENKCILKCCFLLKIFLKISESVESALRL